MVKNMGSLTFINCDHTEVDVFLSPNIAIEVKAFKATQAAALNSPSLRHYYQELEFNRTILFDNIESYDIHSGFDRGRMNYQPVFLSKDICGILYFDSPFFENPFFDDSIYKKWDKLTECPNSFKSNFGQEDCQIRLLHKYSPLLKQAAALISRIKKFLALVKKITVATKRLLHVAFNIHNKVSRSPTLQKKEPPVGGVKIG